MIAAKVANALALDWPRERLEVIVAVDGAAGRDRRASARGAAPTSCSSCRAAARSARRTPPSRAAARRAASPSRTRTRCWEPDALRALVAPFADPHVGYVCGQVRSSTTAATNQEGVYWRYEMWLRAQRVGAGLGHRRQRRDLRGAPRGLRRGRPGHGPRPLVPVQHGQARLARGLRARGAGDARRWSRRSRASGARKRRMMSHAWPIVLRGGLLDPRGYPPLYALMIVSHRLLRYATPLLHLRRGLRHRSRCCAAGGVYRVALAAQVALLAAAARAAACARARCCVARYYVLTTAVARRRPATTTCATARRRAGTPPEGTR